MRKFDEDEKNEEEEGENEDEEEMEKREELIPDETTIKLYRLAFWLIITFLNKGFKCQSTNQNRAPSLSTTRPCPTVSRGERAESDVD